MLLLLRSAGSASVVRPRAPARSDVRGPAALALGWISGPSLALLAGATAVAPFVSALWQNPTGAARASTFDAAPAPLSLRSTPAAAPFAQFDWPLPQRAAPPAALAPLARALALLSAPFPFSQTAWPNPAARPAAVPLDLPQALLGLLAPAVASPFFPPVAANPVLRPTVVEGWGRAALTLTPAFGGAQPFSQTDWPNPRAAEFPAFLRLYSAVAQLSAPVVSPFSQSSWPNPAGPAARAQTDGYRNLAALSFVASAPFSQAAWPAPTAPLPRAQPEPAQRNLPVLTAPPPPMPFRQADWQLAPRAPTRPFDLYAFAPAFATVATPPVAPPFSIGNTRAWFLGLRARATTFPPLARAAVYPTRRRAWLLSEDPMTTLEKRTSESIKFDLDFSQMLAAGETISSVSSIAATPVSAITPLVFGTGVVNVAPVSYYSDLARTIVDHVAPIGTVVQVTISGGQIAVGASVQQYIVRAKVATTINSVVEGTGLMLVNDTPQA
jgi:hypothetical protein